MRFREPFTEPQSPSPAGPEAGANLDNLRTEGDTAGDAADAAIDRALSHDSLSYNEASQQTGGQ